MINLDSIEKYPSAFPVFKSHNLINGSLYQDLKATWPDFTKFRTTGFSPSASGGTERPEILQSGIEIKLKNHNYNKINIYFKQLFGAFNSKEFRQFIAQKFGFGSAAEKGFVDDSQLVMHVGGGSSLTGPRAEARPPPAVLGENPPTLGVYFLIYFGPTCGTQNNLGIFVLSQNNSYLKECKLKDPFIYGGYANRISESLFRCGEKTQNYESAQYRDRDRSPARCRQIGDDLWSRSP